ncbi:hypothetical protein L484_003762 [Morus notabilis]|uniref:Growth-regulating factor n=1 Tax=Morus notabilis TaxID=981085 RepID=W9ST70_9ROSA|nr:hypothetical protein L484_003762 [Morus notabilis]
MDRKRISSGPCAREVVASGARKRFSLAVCTGERSEGTAFDDHWRSSKLSKSNSDADFSASKALRNSNLLMRSNSTLAFFDNIGHPQHQMLSFSSPKPEPLPYSPNTLSAYNSRNMAGFNSGSLVNGGNVMHGEKCVFTPSQWMELEQQALIYKYITANVPNPSNLPLPIRKTFDSVGFSSFPSGLLRPNNTLGWGAFHLGFSNNNDPEPGRCRRTDGKKWRCSRDAVADQKYCERHMNRGRHRSRKPVEGQTGHSLAGANAVAINSTSSVALPVGGTASNSLAATSTNMNHQHQLQSLNRWPKSELT